VQKPTTAIRAFYPLQYLDASPSSPSLPHPSFSPPLSFHSPPFPLALEVGPLKSSYGIGRSAVSFPSGVWGRTPAKIEFGAL